MAAKKMETGNPIAVAALLVILVGAIVATIVRIGSPAQVAAAPTEAAVEVAESRPVGPFVVFRPTYNPFKKPAELSAEVSAMPVGPRMTKLLGSEYPGKPVSLMPLSDIRIEPLGTAGHDARPAPGVQSPKASPVPSFTLLTTVRSGNRVFAVIQVGGSGSRTVGVGDVLDGGYVVEALTAEYAILTNGRQTLRIEKLRDVSREAVP